jgi:hypothetical protein
MRRMNSTSRGLRPTTGLRRPGDPICVGKGRRPARKRLGRPISIGAKASGRRPACADREGVSCVGEGRRPARKRLGRPISIGATAFGPRLACADREIPFASAKADARRAAPEKADFNRRNSLRPTTGLRRPKERKMPTSRLSHRRAPRVHRFGPELIGRATLTSQRETSGQTGSGSPPDNSIIPGEDPTACGRLPRARPLPPSRTERDGFVRRAGKAGFPCHSDIPGPELVEGLK